MREMSRFRRNDDGSLTIFSLFVFVIMLFVSGLAIDFMRTEAHRTRIQATLDRAILAASSMEQTLDAKQVVVEYFETADLLQYLDQSKITVKENAFSKTVTAEASADVQPFFLQFLGYDSLPAKAMGRAREGFSNIEVSLVLDVSGSMGWTSAASGHVKLEDLKDAAQEFVYRIMCNPDTENVFVDSCTVDPKTVSVNLIVYNQQVVVGEDLIQEFDISDEHTISSCVDFSHADYFNTAIPLNQKLQRAGNIDPWGMWYKTNTNPWYSSPEVQTENYRMCAHDKPAHEILPLEDKWTVLYDRIELLTSGGNTSIDIGMKWGAALLDPEFRPAVSKLADLPNTKAQKVIPEFLARPADYTDTNVEKFVVLMTDGVNTSSYHLKDGFYEGKSNFWVGLQDDGMGNVTEVISVYRESQDQYINPMTGAWSDEPFGEDAYELDYTEVWNRWKVDFYQNGQNNAGAHNWISAPFSAEDNATKNANLVAMCEAVRDQNVQIYTVGFETTTSSTSTMKKCASSHAHHFDADGGSIDDAFAAIARSIQKLRLVN